MRRLMWFSMGFGGACALGAYLFAPWMIWLTVAAGFLCVVAFLLRKKWKILRQTAAVLLGFAIGLSWFVGYDRLYLASARPADANRVDVVAFATDYSFENDYGSVVEAKLRLDGKTYRCMLYIYEDMELRPGDEIRGQFKLRLTHDGIQEDTYHRGKGIFLLAYQSGNVTFTQKESVPNKYLASRLRRWLTNTIEEAFPKDTAFFAKALLLGDRSDVDYEHNTAFKVSGISHIIAVSGLHVSILLSVVMLLCRRKRFLVAAIGIPTLLLFAAVAGFTPSITRACIMQILMILSLLLNREYDPPTALSFAALAMLAVNPLVITSVSFQLSVGCMAGIFLFSGRIQNWIVSFSFWKDWKGKKLKVRLRQWFATGVGVTVGAMFFTTPLVACYFGCVSLVGVVTNLLVLWVVSWIFYGIMLVCLVATFWTNGAAAIAWCISWLIRYVLSVAKGLSSIPMAAVYTKSPYIVAWIVFCYVVLFLFLLWKNRKARVLVCCWVLGLCVALCVSWLEPITARTQMTVLDVGQGQCILLQSEGKNFLIDCGGNYDDDAADIAAETLMSMGIYHLDGVVMTHYDRDHVGGVGYLLSRVPARAIFAPKTDEFPESIPLDSAVFVEEDLELSWNSSKMTIFAPVLASSSNESGLCVLFSGENCDILITGDLSSFGETILLRTKEIPRLTALVAGHHGSKTSTSEALLEHTRPQYVFISAGEDNRYGHPSKSVLERLEAYDCQVFRTDEMGNIVFRR